MNKKRIERIESAVKSSTPAKREVLHVSRLQSTGKYFIQEDIVPGVLDYRVFCRPLAGLPEDFRWTLAEAEAEAARLGRVVECDFLICDEGAGNYAKS